MCSGSANQTEDDNGQKRKGKHENGHIRNSASPVDELKTQEERKDSVVDSNTNELERTKRLDEEKESELLMVLFIPLYRYSHNTQFIICSFGVVICFIAYGYCQELMFQLPGFRPLGMFLTLIQFSMNGVMAFGERRWKRDFTKRIPLKTHSLIAFLSVATMGLSNTSVGYLNYPTHVMFKCCTLIPVLIGGIVIQGKKLEVFDCLAAILMSVGMVFFMLTDSSISPNFNTTGVTLILLALLADAAIGNVQEQAMRKYTANVLEIVFYSNLIGTVYLIIMLAAMGQLLPALTFCNEHMLETYGYGSLFSVFGYCGLQMMLILVRISGAFVAAVVANCRKALTVILSFLAFEKPFSYQYVWSGVVVFTGIFFNMLGKNPALRSWFFHKLVTLRKLILSPFLLCRQYRPVPLDDDPES